MKDDAEDVGRVVERSILSVDKGGGFILRHLMNPSIICLKKQEEG